MEHWQTNWRLIIDPPRDGASNMAIDEAILEAVGQGTLPPTLRLYRWNEPCLSLGFSQPAHDADPQRIMVRHWQIVRRMTGGRAVLHTDEMTYSIALPDGHPLLQGGIVDSYRRLSFALIRALELLGQAVESLEHSEAAKQGHIPVCFEVPSNYEISVQGKKLVGSAQVRRHQGALQHGTLPLTGDISRICDALAFPTDQARRTAKVRVLARATTLAQVLGYVVSWEDCAYALAQGFTEAFDLNLTRDDLSLAEKRRANVLRAERYAIDDWTLRL